MTRFITTQWEIADYDVWGNPKDGFEVNNTFRRERPITLRLTVKTYNLGTEREFNSAYPSVRQVRQALNIKPRVKLELDGDDCMIYVRHAPTDEPLGELFCISHASLSPIRKVETAE